MSAGVSQGLRFKWQTFGQFSLNVLECSDTRQTGASAFYIKTGPWLWSRDLTTLTALTTRYFETLIISALSILGRPLHLEKSRRSEYGLLQVQLECTLCLEPVLLYIFVPSWYHQHGWTLVQLTSRLIV